MTSQEILDKISATKNNSKLTTDQKNMIVKKLESMKPSDAKPEPKAPAPKAKSKPATKKGSSRMIQVAEVLYRDASNYKTHKAFLIPSGLSCSVGDEIDVKDFGIPHAEWRDMISKSMNNPWNDEDDHYSVEVEEVRDYVDGESLDNTDDSPKAKPAKATKQKTGTAKRYTYHYKGKPITDLDEADCEELLASVKKQRETSRKAEKKSKSKPIIEKVAHHGSKIAKAVIKNVSAEDIKDDPKKVIKQMEAVEKLTREYLMKLKTIMGEDFDKETIDGELKEIHTIIQQLKKKYA